MDVAVPPTGPVSRAVVSRDRPGLAWTTASTKAACHDGCKHPGCRVLAFRAEQGSAGAGADARRQTKAGTRAVLLDPVARRSLLRGIRSGREF